MTLKGGRGRRGRTSSIARVRKFHANTKGPRSCTELETFLVYHSFLFRYFVPSKGSSTVQVLIVALEIHTSFFFLVFHKSINTDILQDKNYRTISISRCAKETIFFVIFFFFFTYLLVDLFVN